MDCYCIYLFILFGLNYDRLFLLCWSSKGIATYGIHEMLHNELETTKT